jgi:hypothetical protein
LFYKIIKKRGGEDPRKSFLFTGEKNLFQTLVPHYI